MIALICNPVLAHDPFDGATKIIVQKDTLDVTVTLGSDAAREFLVAVNTQPRDVARMTRPAPDEKLIDLPKTSAPKLLALNHGSQLLEASSFQVAPDDNEIIFIITYPRLTADTLLVRATYFDLIKYMQAGSFVAANQHGEILASALFSHSNSSISIPLKGTPTSSITQQPSFSEFFRLGVEHILAGFDHLLFLCALLVGVHRIRPMLIIITSFTLAHSVTLAIAALDLMVIPARLVEPLIAASIIFVGVENLLRRDKTADRYWMAGTFGLIHGFGFASVLRDMDLGQAGNSILIPLLSFNLGVETGQLMVAAAVVPLLLLLRKKSVFMQYGSTGISVIVIVISTYWLLQRTFV